VNERPTRDLLIVASALFLWGIGEGIFTYFQPLYLRELGADPVLIGMILSIMGIFMTVSQLPAGYLSDRFGPRPGMWAAWLTGTLAAIIMAAAGTLPTFVVGLALYGLCAFVVAPMNSYLTSVRGNWTIERAITIPSVFYNAGMVLGAVLGGFVASRSGIHQIYIISAVIFVFSTAVVFFARPAPRDAHHEITASRPNLFRNPRFIGLIVVIFFTMLALYLPQPLTPNYLNEQAGLSYQTIGMLGAIGSLGNAVIGFWMRGRQAPSAFIIGQILMFFYTALLWKGSGVGWFALGYFFIGGYRLVRVMSLAYARKFIRASETGLAYGFIETANSSAVIFAPFLAGLLYSVDPPLMYIVSLIAIASVVLVNLLIKNILSTPFVLPVMPLEPHTSPENVDERS
jgi:MFS family permease